MLSYAMTYHHAVDPFLRDETQIYLRRIRSTDKQKLLEHFKGLSPSSSYNRFFCVRKEWSKQELKRFTEPNLVRHVALVATIGNGPQEKIVGDGRYVIEGSESIAELALFVLDAYQNRGIGTLLLVHLVQRARCAGAIRDNTSHHGRHLAYHADGDAGGDVNFCAKLLKLVCSNECKDHTDKDADQRYDGKCLCPRRLCEKQQIHAPKHGFPAEKVRRRLNTVTQKGQNRPGRAGKLDGLFPDGGQK